MPSRRHFANQAPQQTLNAAINNTVTSLIINGSFSGWPTSFPFFASLDFGTATAEIISVTGVSGTTATIVRGQDGTAAVSHAAGATLDHVNVALDFDEANAHTSASAGVHGISGSVVGTSDVQTLTNKTFTGTTALATVTATGITATTVTATDVAGIIQPKQYTNEAAAGTATLGNLVYLTAPTGGGSPGLYAGDGTNWKQVGAVSGSGNRTGGRAQTNHSQSISSSALVTLNNTSTTNPWATLDDSGGYVTTDGGAPLKAVTAGLYIVTAQVSASLPLNSGCYIRLLKNGATASPLVGAEMPASASPGGGSFSAAIVLAANDNIGIQGSFAPNGMTVDATLSLYKISN